MIDKVLFLDIDGVLNSNKSIDLAIYLEPGRIKLLNNIIEQTKCEVVISSTWRLENGPLQLEKLLTQAGYKWYILGYTPTIPDRERGTEIKVWLARHPTQKFVILDDNDDMGNLFPYLVKTTSDEGLTEAKAQEVIKKFNG